ncbi:MAG: ATP-binding protein [Sumerlaeia bacterium]
MTDSLQPTRRRDGIVAPLGFARELRRASALPNEMVFATLAHRLSAVSSAREAGTAILDAADALFWWDAAHINLYPEARPNETYPLLNCDRTEDGRRIDYPIPKRGLPITKVSRHVLTQGPIVIYLDEHGNIEAGSSPSKGLEFVPYGEERISRSLMFVPIRKGETNIGVLSVQTYEPQAYSREDLETLQVLADHCSGALARCFVEDELRLSEERMRLVLDQIPSIIWTLDRNLCFMSLMGSGIEELGIAQDNFIGQPFRTLLSDATDHSEAEAKHRRALLGAGSTFDFHWHEKVYNCAVRPLRDSEGQIIGCMSVGQDITLRKHAEEALRRAREELEERVRHRTEELARSEAIYREAIANADGVPYRMQYGAPEYEFMGNGIEELLEMPAENVSKKLFIECLRDWVIVDPDVDMTVPEYTKAFAEGKIAKYRMDLKVVLPNGKEKWLADFSIPVKDPRSGKVTGSLGILQDITKRKDVEEQIRQRQERLSHAEKLVALGTLVSGVAHEINNPNNFIMLNLPVLQDAWQSIEPILDHYHEEHGDFLVGGLNYSDLREEIPRLFNAVMDGAHRIRNIVRELGDFARPTGDRVNESVDMSAVVTSALVLLQNVVKNSTDDFQAQCDNRLPPIAGNTQRLEQVVINLIQNACQALTGKDQSVRVSTAFDYETRMVELRVSDQGCGIPADILKQIEVPFFTTKRDTGGTGLGLSITSNIVVEHKGTLDFESTPGEGTTVIVRFPTSNDTSDFIERFDHP